MAVGAEDGHLVALNAETGAHLVTIKACGAPLSAVRFSPNGELLAIAAQTGSLYLYSVSRYGHTYKKFGKIPGRSDNLIHLDWNQRGDFLRTVSSESDLSYWNVTASKVWYSKRLEISPEFR